MVLYHVDNLGRTAELVDEAAVFKVIFFDILLMLFAIMSFMEGWLSSSSRRGQHQSSESIVDGDGSLKELLESISKKLNVGIFEVFTILGH